MSGGRGREGTRNFVPPMKSELYSFKKIEETVKKLDLDDLVVIGGDDSNTNTCLLAEHLRRDVYGAWEQYLGLEHTDNAPKRSYVVNQFEGELYLLAKDQGYINQPDLEADHRADVSRNEKEEILAKLSQSEKVQTEWRRCKQTTY
ncbi:Pyrophosphate--fructose 6-phosphate 1-phosphotransferase subunit beta 2 [Glycine max]|nr:Pyrophosphate--fructose 6-phosphate 1-phosphotransferase subunit beta 2 [Glycine max]